jgi:hypothetical protein
VNDPPPPSREDRSEGQTLFPFRVPVCAPVSSSMAHGRFFEQGGALSGDSGLWQWGQVS